MSEYLINGPVNPELITRIISINDEKNDAGAISVFIGRVRADRAGDNYVVAIEYSAYEEMINTVIVAINEAVITKFSDVKSVNIIHSTGIVRAGEISLFVSVTAGHRRHAMDACSMTVELIKEKLPVWKKEHYDNESQVWKQ
jgi:molybdopterin synthase catalytic subunit